nr:MAG TPA: hypothetical protein [Caudoviricetes sp.]DAO60811.1 MAG TPA: hypothetical protein [Caudoviricetes sp.]DAX12126.1 MAG TPA: hypothetical protein [Bacteriophage sp.]
MCFFHTQNYRLPGGKEAGRPQNGDWPEKKDAAEERKNYGT